MFTTILLFYDFFRVCAQMSYNNKHTNGQRETDKVCNVAH